MPDQHRLIFAAILAAGRSSRFGATKQAVELNGASLVKRATSTASRICENKVVMVIGYDWQTVLASAGAGVDFLVFNEDYDNGLGSSIACAARACRKNADAILLLLADQPLITAEHLQALIDAWSGADDEVVATAFGNTEGPPVLLPRGTFDDLCLLSGDKGAHGLLCDDRFQLKTVRFEPAAVDIDTPADLATLI